jgi:undecaprenyl-diphosphatase
MFKDIVSWSESIFLPLGAAGLFVVAFIESSFFPVPPDIILIPLVLLNPKMGFLYATFCTLGSVLGALFGYWIGIKGGRPLLLHMTKISKVERAEKVFSRYGALAVAMAGFTPIPYKLFTITAGVLQFNLIKFLLASFISRGARFYLEAFFLILWGEQILAFIHNWFGILTLSVALILIAGYFGLKRL